MLYRKLGRTGVDTSVISLGAEHLEKEDRETIKDVVSTAVDNGVNLIDLIGMVAPESRDNMGAALRGIREKVMLSAHFGATSHDYVFAVPPPRWIGALGERQGIIVLKENQ